MTTRRLLGDIRETGGRPRFGLPRLTALGERPCWSCGEPTREILCQDCSYDMDAKPDPECRVCGYTACECGPDFEVMPPRGAHFDVIIMDEVAEDLDREKFRKGAEALRCLAKHELAKVITGKDAAEWYRKAMRI